MDQEAAEKYRTSNMSTLSFLSSDDQSSFKLRSSKYRMSTGDLDLHAMLNNLDRAQEEEEEEVIVEDELSETTNLAVMAAYSLRDESERPPPRDLSLGRSRIVRSSSADLVVLRAADSPQNNQFLYVTAGARGAKLDVKMGRVDPRKGEGQGVFQRRRVLDEGEMSMVYSYTNLRFHKALGVHVASATAGGAGAGAGAGGAGGAGGGGGGGRETEGRAPTVTLMEPAPSPVSSSDPRMFRKPRGRWYHGFRLQSVLLKDFYITYDNTGDVSLTRTGSPFTEKVGNPVAADEVDGMKRLSPLNRPSVSPVAAVTTPPPPPPPPAVLSSTSIVAEYSHPYHHHHHHHHHNTAMIQNWLSPMSLSVAGLTAK